MRTRIEKDTMGSIEVDASRYWGAQTERSRRNFKIGGERMPIALIHAYARLKLIAAEVNGSLGFLKPEWVDAIKNAAQEVVDGKLDDHFPLVVWQTGSGTQTNMNLNEVIAYRANMHLGKTGVIHPNDHVDMGQSTNDTFPTAMHIAVALAVHTKLLPVLHAMHSVLSEKAKEFQHLIKVSRTHMQDATPITLGQEFNCFGTQVKLAIDRIESALPRIYRIAMGGTAVGTGLNCPKGFKEEFSKRLSEQLGFPFAPADDLFEAIATHDTMVEFSGQLNVMAASFLKMANDIRFLGSGPMCGLGELYLPANEPGSSIMPGKVNPTQAEAMTMVCCQVIGNHMAITMAGSQGHFQLNEFKPVIIFNLLQSITLLTDASQSFTDNCLQGIKPNEKKLKGNIDKSLMLVTALNPIIGYEKAAEVAKCALSDNISLKEAAVTLGYLSDDEFDAVVVPERMLGV